jgi:hypothetical protein
MAWTLCTILFFLFFIFSILQGSWTGYLSQEDLAEFGYRSERKVKSKIGSQVDIWQPWAY